MKQTLQLKLTQHLTLTPQLQQSIRLLQLSTLELNAEVDRMLQENPLLEREEGEDEVPPQEFPVAGISTTPAVPERAARDEEGEGEAEGMTGVDTAPTRDDLPDVTDFADFSGGSACKADSPRPRAVARPGSDHVKLRARKSVVAIIVQRSGARCHSTRASASSSRWAKRSASTSA